MLFENKIILKKRSVSAPTETDGADYAKKRTTIKKRGGINQAWFPKEWTSKDIRHAGEHVASLKGNRYAKDGAIVWGMWKGVRVGVKRTYGKIATIFLDSHQPTKRRK